MMLLAFFGPIGDFFSPFIFLFMYRLFYVICDREGGDL